MFCGSCGKFIEEGSKFCTGCGQKVTPIGSRPIEEITSVTTNPDPINTGSNNTNYQDDVVCKTQDKVNVWLVIVGFLIPIVGLILFITLKKKTPKKANAIGIAALVATILSVVAFIAVIIFVGYMFVGLSEVYNLDSYDNYYYDDDYYYYEDYEYDFDEELNKLEDELDKYYQENTI